MKSYGKRKRVEKKERLKDRVSFVQREMTGERSGSGCTTSRKISKQIEEAEQETQERLQEAFLGENAFAWLQNTM